MCFYIDPTFTMGGGQVNKDICVIDATQKLRDGDLVSMAWLQLVGWTGQALGYKKR